ncbi:MAG: peptidoglycan editing factor PgeF [Actinobacteria bacterium]|nr:peptidoglycan editing factor PgeF [Actinomycetota bacterium]
MAFERRRLGRRGHALVPTALEKEGFSAAFTERSGGSSPPPFDSLNLSFSVEDSPGNVRENRVLVATGLGIPSFATAEQVHGSAVARVGPGRAGAGFADLDSRIPGADALATRSPGVGLAVLVADCLPVVMASSRERTLAVVHAGWRGLAAGILARAAGLFESPAEVRVAIGPAIGVDHYEVGEDVALAVAAASPAGAVTERRGGRVHLDLAGTARAALRSLGVRRVEVADVCTACERRRFFSHRRDGPSGRQAVVAWRPA